MSQISVDVAKVRQVSKGVLETVVSMGSIPPAEIILGLAEALGRAIGAQEGSHIMHNEWMRTAINHMATTVRTKYAAEGRDPNAIM